MKLHELWAKESFEKNGIEEDYRKVYEKGFEDGFECARSEASDYVFSLGSNYQAASLLIYAIGNGVVKDKEK